MVQLDGLLHVAQCTAEVVLAFLVLDNRSLFLRPMSDVAWCHVNRHQDDSVSYTHLTLPTIA